METIQKVLRRAQRVANARPMSSSAIALGVGAPVVALVSLAVSVLVNLLIAGLVAAVRQLTSGARTPA